MEHMATETPSEQTDMSFGVKSQERTIEIYSDMLGVWLKIGTEQNLTSDTQIVHFLLTHYINCQDGLVSACCSKCKAPLTLTCTKCQHPPQTDTTVDSTKTVLNSANGKQFLSNSEEYVSESSSLQLRQHQHRSPSTVMYNLPGGKNANNSSVCEKNDGDTLTDVSVKLEPHTTAMGYDALPVHFQQSVQDGFSDGSDVQTSERKTDCVPLAEANSFTLGGMRQKSSTPQNQQQGTSAVLSRSGNTVCTQAGKELFSCSKCDATFRWKNHLRGHLHKVHAISDIPPSSETLTSSSGRKLRKRKHTDLNIQLHVCTECDASFPKACQLRIHMRGHTGEKPFVCSVCNAAFCRSYKLKNHMRRHTGEKPYFCEECGSSFSSSGILKEHARIHTGERPYVCAQCNMSFVQHSALKTHLKSHSAEKPYKCKLCENAYKSFHALKRHVLHYHEKVPREKKPSSSQSDEKVCICEECGKTFSDTRNLKKHMIIHGEKSFVCKECGTAFYKSDALKVHTRIHSGEKPYVCTVCGKAFIQSSSFNKHMRVHTGERPYVCSHENCGATFKGHAELRNHERIHTQFKPYVCQYCSAAFFQQGNLRQHVRMHTDERPYVCETCGKAFRRLNQLKVHNLMHAGLKPCECKICGAAFRKPQTLKLHIQKKHASLEIVPINSLLQEQR